MKLVIDATEVADQLTDCKPGDEKLITVTVGSNDGETINGEATEVEHLTGGEEYEEEEDEEMPEMTHGKMAKSKKMPKAILLVAGK